MTLPSQTAFSGPYLADSVQTVFPYAFRVDQGNELEVIQGDALGLVVTTVPPSAYSLVGIGAATGGEVVFAVPPQAGLRIMVRRARPYSQTTDYRTGDPFLAETHEGTYDDVVQLVQQLLEEVSRRPALPLDTLVGLRNLFFPRPLPLKLWGWDALGTGISYYDPALVQVIPATVGDPGALAAGWYQSTKTVTVSAAAFAGQAQIPIPDLYPSSGYIRSVTLHVTTAFGSSQGLTTLSLGDAGVSDRWGSGIAPTATTQTNPAFFHTQPFGQHADGTALLTAETGTFDGVGQATVVCHYEMFWPDLPSGGVVPTTGGWAHGKNTVALTSAAFAGQAAIPIPLLYPAGAYIRAVTLRITAGFGLSNGLTTLSLGDAGVSDRWGEGLPTTLGTVTSAANFRSPALGLAFVAGTDGILQADAGLFDAEGAALVTCHFEVFLPD